MGPVRVLFACRKNAGRSILGEALFNRYADTAKATATSAGPFPVDAIYEEVPKVLEEVGVHIDSGEKPRKLTPQVAEQAQLLVTLGCDKECPTISGQERLDWAIADPSVQGVEGFRQMRDQTTTLVVNLLTERGWLKQ